jgi:hypothetical protein
MPLHPMLDTLHRGRPTSDRSGRPTVYLVYADEELLYVGTCSPGQRFGRHARESSWFLNVTHWHVRHCRDVEHMEDLEAALIRVLKPRHNIALIGNPDEYDVAVIERQERDEELRKREEELWASGAFTIDAADLQLDPLCECGDESFT